MKHMKFRVLNREHQQEIFNELIRIGCLRPVGFDKEPFNHLTPFIIVVESVIKWSKSEEIFIDQRVPETTLEELKLM